MSKQSVFQPRDILKPFDHGHRKLNYVVKQGIVLADLKQAGESGVANLFSPLAAVKATMVLNYERLGFSWDESVTFTDLEMALRIFILAKAVEADLADGWWLTLWDNAPFRPVEKDGEIYIVFTFHRGDNVGAIDVRVSTESGKVAVEGYKREDPQRLDAIFMVGAVQLDFFDLVTEALGLELEDLAGVVDAESFNQILVECIDRYRPLLEARKQFAAKVRELAKKEKSPGAE